MENNPQIEKENVKRHSCQNCGADMVFDPSIGKLACPYCDAQLTIQTNLADIVERDFESFLRPEADRLQPLAKDAMQVTCNSCGATVTFIPPETATSLPVVELPTSFNANSQSYNKNYSCNTGYK